jgi:hypothetical protein
MEKNLISNLIFFVDASGDGIVGYLSGNGCFVGDMNGNNQALTIMFTIGGVDFNRIIENVRRDPDNFFAWVSPNMEVISVAGYFKEIEEAKKRGSIFTDRPFLLCSDARRQ